MKTHARARKGRKNRRERESSQMVYSLLNLSVIAVRLASTQQSPGLLQGLLNGFTSSSHSAARTETLNTSLQSINNRRTLLNPASHTVMATETGTKLHTNFPRSDIRQCSNISQHALEVNAYTISWLRIHCASQNVCMWPPGTKQA